MKKHERPNAQTMTDDEIIELIGEMGETGASLKSVCDAHNYVYRTVMNRIRSSEELSALDARARQDYTRERARQLNEIAAKEPDVQRARLMCDNIKWEAARVLPKEFGDRIQNTHEGAENGAPILQHITVSFVGKDSQK